MNNLSDTLGLFYGIIPDNKDYFNRATNYLKQTSSGFPTTDPTLKRSGIRGNN